MKKIVIGLFILNFCISSFAQNTSSAISETDFKNPPHTAKPITWMHVMSGNMSKEGMTKDLEAIADAGIGGIILFNVTHNIPNGPVDFNSPEDIEMKAHTAAECERLGLSFGIHNCDGWTSSGGPWVPVEHSMKQVVYREIVVDGGEIDLFLPGASHCGGFYEDIATIAYPALASEISDAENRPEMTCSNLDFDLNIVTNGKIDERSELRVKPGKTSWIQWDYGKPVTARYFMLKSENQRLKIKGSLLAEGEEARRPSFYLQTSDDGIHFKNVRKLNLLRHGKYFYTIDQVLDGITARYFRFVTDFALDIEEVNLSTTRRYDNMISRTSIRRTNNGALPKIKDPEQEMLIKKESILNLTEVVDSQGRINTTLPPGKWTIMRVGYTTTKAINDPAAIVGTGYEVDKFSRESFKLFYDGYVQKVVDASKEVAPNAMQWVEIDSYEVGSQNWTKGYEKLFQEQFGYDLLDFLPIYAGRFIDNGKTTEQVLWDIRNFNSQLMCDNYFDYFTELCHKDGLKSYVEPYGNAGFNTLDASRTADYTMGEFHLSQKYMTDQAISAGHIYGKNIISAEAFTSGSRENYSWVPSGFKPIGDKAWALGINEFCFHRFAHQPNTHVEPGMTMSGFSSNIDRTQTWWYNGGKAWFTYIARGQYLLRQGVPVADLLVYVGDGSPNTTVSRKGLGNLPNRINYDCVNYDVLKNRISVEDGHLVLPEGTRYLALYLSNIREIHLTTLKRLAELADQGVIIIGGKPRDLGGYAPTKQDKKEFNALVEKIWSKPTTITPANWDKIYQQFNLPIDLRIKEGEHINYSHRKSATEDIFYFYNPKKEAYTYECTFNVDGKIPELFNPTTGKIKQLAAFEFHNGQTKVAVPINAEGVSFVVFRKPAEGVQSISVTSALNQPELELSFDEKKQLSVYVAKTGTYDLIFNDGIKQHLEVASIPTPIGINGEWEVTFFDLKAGKETFVFPELIDWTSYEDEGVKHYSGTATYKTTFKIAKKQLVPKHKLVLDLGKVHEIAQVIVNGKDLGVIWKSPFVLDVTSALKAGKNELRIEITNQWANRLIGDENFPILTGYDITAQINAPLTAKDPHLTLINRHKMVDWYVNNEPAPLGQRSTFCTYPFYKKGDKLLPAGLVGPVKLTFSKILE